MLEFAQLGVFLGTTFSTLLSIPSAGNDRTPAVKAATAVDAPVGAGRRLPRDGDLAARAYRGIREAILSISLQPGQPLQEGALADWLGTSRTPVREALRRLHSEGLVESATMRGFVVTQVSVEDVEHAYRVIEVLEGLSSRMAAERLDADSANHLRRLLDAMRKAAVAGRLDDWARTDADLHDYIRAAAANPKLSQMAGLMYPIVERVRNIYLREGNDPDRLARITQAHCDLGEAILGGDPQRAEALARQLFADARSDNVRLLRQWVVPLRRSF